MRLFDCLPAESIVGFDGRVPPADDIVLPITQISKPTEIDALADPLLDVVTAHTGSVAALGPAFHMAVSELCGNAVEHGRNRTGAFLAAQRYEEPRRLSLAIADLGVGIPEHVRQQFPAGRSRSLPRRRGWFPTDGPRRTSADLGSATSS